MTATEDSPSVAPPGSPGIAPHFGAKALSGAAWLTLTTVINGMVGALVSVYLARTLGPGPIGEYTLALSTSDLFALLVGWGVEIYVVQTPTLEARRFGTALSLSLILSAAFMVLTIALTVYFFFIRQQLLVAAFLPVLAIQRACFLCGWCYSAWLQRSFRFGSLAVLQLVNGMIVHIVAISVAVLGGGAWALMMRDLLDAAISFAGARLISGVPFRLAWDPKVWRELRSFGAAILVSQGGELAVNHLDSTLLGLTWGTNELAFYGEAFKLGDVVRRASRPALSQVALTSYARLRGDPDRLTAVFHRVQSLGWLALAPMAATLAFVPEAAISFLFGDKWLPAIPIARVMAVYVAVIPLFDHVVQLLQSQGNPGAVARAKLVQLIVFLAALFALMPRFGGTGTAAAVDLGVFGGFVVAALFARRYVGLGGHLWRAYGLAFLVALGAGALAAGPAATLPALVRLIGLWAIYSLVIAIRNRKDIAFVLAYVRTHALPLVRKGAPKNA